MVKTRKGTLTGIFNGEFVLRVELIGCAACSVLRAACSVLRGRAMKRRVLFVCFGNTCRSPMAEAIFKKLVAEGGISDQWDADSAGTSNFALGCQPDNRALSCLARHGLSSNHRGRQITKSDFMEFDYIFCMDTRNLSLLEQFSKDFANTKAHPLLLGSLDPHEELIISDPFNGGSREYERAYEQCLRCIRAFLSTHS